LPDLFFTLHHQNGGKPFYVSETFRKSRNPYWKHFELISMPKLDSASSNLIVRIWCHEEYGKRVIIEWKVDLKGLTYFGPELESHGNFEFNSILFGLLDGYYHASFSQRKQSETDGTLGTFVKVDTNRVVKSSAVPVLERLSAHLLSLDRTYDQTEELKKEIEKKREQKMMLMKKAEKLELMKTRVALLREQLQRNKRALELEKLEESNLKERIQKRKEGLEDLKNKLHIGKGNLEISFLDLEENRAKLKKTVLVLVERRWELLSQLQTIFNIEIKNEKESLYSICGIILPNTDYTKQDEELIASGLGWVCQAVLITSRYFEVPLRYQIIPMCSRSVIRDDISLQTANGNGNQEFPMYSKGVERFRFDYAVFLLNKNIEQLLNARGYGVQDLRQTLPNFQLLLENEIFIRNRKLEKSDKAMEDN